MLVSLSASQGTRERLWSKWLRGRSLKVRTVKEGGLFSAIRYNAGGQDSDRGESDANELTKWMSRAAIKFVRLSHKKSN